MLKYEDIKRYLDGNGALPSTLKTLTDGNAMLHPLRSDIANQVAEINSVFGAGYPAFMELNRPQERAAHKKYRKEIFKNTVQPLASRVANQYSQISVVEDYEIEWPAIEADAKRNLKALCESKLFAGDELEDFFWAKWTHNILFDPNAVACIIPIPTQSQTETQQFKAMWIRSANVWQHRKNEFAVLKSEETNPIQDIYTKTSVPGIILYFFDQESYVIAKQISINSQSMTSVWDVSGFQQLATDEGIISTFSAPLHQCEGLPIVTAGYLIEKVSEGGKYEMLSSILTPALPHLKKALQRDEDGEIIALHHSVPREWEYAPKKCGTCQGTGKIVEYDKETDEATEHTCPDCKGVGVRDVRNGLGVYQLSPPTMESYDDQMRVVSLPTPPMGRIDGDTNGMEAFQAAFDKQLTLAYRVLGMEHLNQVPVAQSGIAKAYDSREGEMNLVVAGKHGGEKLEWLFHSIERIVFAASGGVREQLPQIRTPKRFDIEGVETLSKRLQDAIKNGFSAEVIFTLQLKYLEVVAGKDSDEYRMYQLRKKIDPYWSLDFEALNFEQTQCFQFMDRQSEAFQRKNALIELSKNFEMLVQDALATTPNFWQLDTISKRAILVEINSQYMALRTDNFEIPPVNMRPTVNAEQINQL